MIAILFAFAAFVALVTEPARFCAQLAVPVKLPRNPSDADTCAKSNMPPLFVILLLSGLYKSCESTLTALLPEVLSTKVKYLVALVVASLVTATLSALVAVVAVVALVAEVAVVALFAVSAFVQMMQMLLLPLMLHLLQ